MFCIFKKVLLKYVFIFYIIVPYFFSNIFAQDSTQLSQQDKKYISKVFHTSVSFSNFKNNDKLKIYKTRSIFILDYLNAVLHRIIDNNKDILSQYGMTEKDININFFIKDRSNAYADIKRVMLVLSEYDLFYKNIFNTDAYIEAMLSHELAHVLLAHVKQSQNLIAKLLKEFIKQHENDKAFKKAHPSLVKDSNDLDPTYFQLFQQYYQSHPSYIDLHKKHEIEADNLGFKIYSNTGCNTECFADFFMDYSDLDQERDILWINYYMLKDLILKITEGSSYPNSTASAKIRSMFTRYHDKIDSRIENYKYTYDPESIIKTWDDPSGHPTHLWRFWNTFKQEKNISEDIRNSNKNITTTEYIKIDLSKFKGLNYVKSLLKKESIPDTPLDLNKINDPRVYLSGALLTEGTNISYNIYSSTSENIDSIGVIKDDNTITLKANDVFRVASVSLVQDINKLDKSCDTLFSRYLEKAEYIIYEFTKYTSIAVSTYVLLRIFGVI